MLSKENNKKAEDKNEFIYEDIDESERGIP